MVKPIAWRFAGSWSCIRCGKCCMLQVPVKIGEALFYQRKFGSNVLEYFNKGFHIRKNENKYCVFLELVKGKAFCNIYSFRPRACILYPFYIYKKPFYGEEDRAKFTLFDEEYYVYIDAECTGVNRGFLPISKNIVDAILVWLGKEDYKQISQLNVLHSSNV
ncbi:MAG: YkgJ family cysteine cluster protein [Nitrososphaeria archaeon]|nr:YkgJ family cysteine cluster protein [Nitrososphaeria archaeon]